MMKRGKKKRINSMQFGFISLPVMACILATVVFVFPRDQVPDVSNLKKTLDESESQASEFSARVQKVKKDVNKLLSGLAQEKKIQERNHELHGRIEVLIKEKKRLELRISEAQWKAALEEKIRKLVTEIAQVDKEIKEIKKKSDYIKNRIELTGLDEFPRPYISVECKKDSVNLFIPESSPRTATLPLSGEESAWLKRKVSQVKGIVLFARSSSFQTSYVQMMSELTDIVEWTPSGELKTALSFVPILDSEDISGNIRLGGGS